MRNTLIILLTCLLTNCKQQTVKINNKINNNKTDAHINVPRTRLFILPPKNFIVETGEYDYTLMQRNGTEIRVKELDRTPFNENAKIYSDDFFAEDGLRVAYRESVTVNGFGGLAIKLHPKDGQRTLLLAFGDVDFCINIMVVMPVSDEKVENTIIAALNSVYYDSNKDIDPYTTEPFAVNESQSIFKFMEYGGGFYFYTPRRNYMSGAAEDPNMDLSKSKANQPLINDKDAERFMLVIAKENHLQKPIIKDLAVVKTEGVTKWEGVTQGERNGKKVQYYCSVIKKDVIVLVFQGNAGVDFEKYLPEFKKLADGVKFK